MFRAMLKSDMVEKLDGVIRIEDASVEDVRQMVRYMYTAKIEHQYTRVKELLVLANKYQVLELVNYCSSKIFESLSEDNALEIGMFGEMHNSEMHRITSRVGPIQRAPTVRLEIRFPQASVHILVLRHAQQ